MFIVILHIQYYIQKTSKHNHICNIARTTSSYSSE